jgi:ABC-type microcin C transport system permease subunit YejB
MTRQIRSPRYFDHFLNRLEELIAFIAHVAGIDPALLSYRTGDRNQLVGVCIRAGHVLQAGRHAPCTLAHGGVGRLALDAVVRRDYPVLQGAVLFIAAVFLVINLLVDLLYAKLDPRISVR